ncbi:hypothetical protein BofuT4_uP068230.1 [Botrytis cinerea T4]|uniref:Uncharacterized protein n=1 Tax=Botryotinia fuckeliana (strain T4) TaxID=999810 RepID=G2XQZ0_BOTF4|nr:hypothetical protein BofuT4_uP068230.1 [Botrytis cinerea T4]
MWIKYMLSGCRLVRVNHTTILTINSRHRCVIDNINIGLYSHSYMTKSANGIMTIKS